MKIISHDGLVTSGCKYSIVTKAQPPKKYKLNSLYLENRVNIAFGESGFDTILYCVI